MIDPTPEQIEAGARALFEASQELDQDNSWDDQLPDEWREAWRNAARDTIVAAAGAAPKEWGAIWPDSCTGEPSRWGNKEGTIRSYIESNPGMRLVRRRAAGPWEPVGGESNGDS